MTSIRKDVAFKSAFSPSLQKNLNFFNFYFFEHVAHMQNWIVLFSVALMAMSSPAFAATCDAQAAEKKLVGAGKNSFVQKCEKDAAAALAAATSRCEAQATKKKPAGAAKNSFTNKCIKDATGG